MILYLISVALTFSFLFWSIKEPNISYENGEHKPIGLKYGNLLFIFITSTFSIINIFACLIMFIIILSKADVLGYKVVFGENYKHVYKLENVIKRLKTFFNKELKL